MQDTLIGTWHLNVGKSKFDPGPPPKNYTINVAAFGSNGHKFTADGVDPQGNPIHLESTSNIDGEDYPLKGSPIVDVGALRRIDANTTISAGKKAGEVTLMQRGVVSKDGKTFIVDRISVTPQGQATYDLLVYDKQ